MKFLWFLGAQVSISFVVAQWVSHPVSELSKKVRSSRSARLTRRDVDPETLYPAYNLSVPIDHFHNESRYEPHSNGTFNLRYWFDASHYKPGGPVIVLGSGETSGTDRLPFLQKGIVAILAEATGGIGVILEHRYYGTSFPVPDLSVENLRFLSHDQALADTAYFATHVRFEGLEGNFTAPHTPWIAYGGSYAGAFVAFLRVRYPDIFWGSISSSGVPLAIYDYWQYFEPIRIYGPQDCIKTTQNLTNVVDNILLNDENQKLIPTLKGAFGLSNLTYNDDFGNVLSSGITWWQSRNWDPEVGSPSLDQYCSNVTSDELLYPETSGLRETAQQLIAASGWEAESAVLTSRMLNYIGYINLTRVSGCTRSNSSQDACFGTRDPKFYQQDDLSQEWRAWPWQYCTNWGYLQTGSGVPADILPLISRTIDLPYLMIICNEAFNITEPANVTDVNKYGGLDIEFDRLAFIDGEQDPWREAGPHAFDARARSSTTNRPFILIDGAVHHWDENGVFPNETRPGFPPDPVVQAQEAQKQFVNAWLDEWRTDSPVTSRSGEKYGMHPIRRGLT